MSYFKYFPIVEYPYLGKLVDSPYSTTIKTVDMSVRYKMIDRIRQDPTRYYSYMWQDGDRPDIVAQKEYGDVNMAWVVLLAADIFDWGYDVPMNESVFQKYLESKYGTSDHLVLDSQTHHYEDSFGYTLDFLTYQGLSDAGKRRISVYEYESNNNEARREVSLLNRGEVNSLIREFTNNMYDIKNARRAAGL